MILEECANGPQPEQRKECWGMPSSVMYYYAMNWVINKDYKLISQEAVTPEVKVQEFDGEELLSLTEHQRTS